MPGLSIRITLLVYLRKALSSEDFEFLPEHSWHQLFYGDQIQVSFHGKHTPDEVTHFLQHHEHHHFQGIPTREELKLNFQRLYFNQFNSHARTHTLQKYMDITTLH